MITEDYVSFETAKLLKEKGFDVPTRFVWYEKLPYDLAIKPGTFNKPGIDLYFMSKTTEHNSLFDNKDKAGYIEGEVYSCPSQSLALKWLRKVHNIFIYIIPVEHGNCFSSHVLYNGIDKVLEGVGFGTYEEVVETALKYCLAKLI